MTPSTHTRHLFLGLLGMHVLRWHDVNLELPLATLLSRGGRGLENQPAQRSVQGEVERSLFSSISISRVHRQRPRQVSNARGSTFQAFLGVSLKPCK